MMKSRIMYIERKSEGLAGPARIGRVRFSQTGRTLYYAGRTFQKLKGYKANHFDVETGEEYWISGCKVNGEDTLYGGTVAIDDDVRDEYWSSIRCLPSRSADRTTAGPGKHSR
jgi:hypothetical protein